MLATYSDRYFPQTLRSRWEDHHGLVQIFLGPRQVGKTTAALQLAERSETRFFAADRPAPPSTDEIEREWNAARELPAPNRTLILDEIQKVPGWSEVIKRLWDEDQRNKTALRVAILGSSALEIEKGLSESLTGRFEVNFFPHWTYFEVAQLKSVSWKDYIFFGGYPKAYDFLEDRERAREYIDNSIVEPTLGRDILALHSVDKPALLRQLFWYVCRTPCRIVGYQKILGELQDRGNSATLAHYADLLRLAFLVVPIFKYTKQRHRAKRSLPKWVFPNPALIADREQVSGDKFGFLFENLIGSHLLNLIFGKRRFELTYWRERNDEIDFVVTEDGKAVLAIESKTNSVGVDRARLARTSGIDCPFLVVNPSNVEDFLTGKSIQQLVELA